MVLEAAVPTGELSRAAKSSNRLQRTVNTLDETGHLSTAARYTARAADTARAPARYAGTQLTRGLAASKTFGDDVARRLLHEARTAGQKVRWARHADELSSQSARLVADGGVDFRRAVYRAAESDAVDYAQLDRALRRIDDLDGATQVRARQLVRDADGSGVRLIDDLDDASLQPVLDVDIERARQLRAAFADNYARGYATLDEVDEFARHSQNLKGIDGLNSGPVDDFINAGSSGNVRGALDEVRRADEIGAENIQRMNLELSDGNRDVGELDIQLESGEIVESKRSFGYDPREVNSQFETKLETMRDHPDVEFDGNTLEIRANQIGDEAMVESKIAEWQSRVATSDQWNNADITIEVIDESTGTVITG